MSIITEKSKKERLLESAVEARALGKDLTICCARYNFCGTVREIGGSENDGYIVLDGAKMPGKTGPLSEKEWKKVEIFPDGVWNVSIAFIESWGSLK